MTDGIARELKFWTGLAHGLQETGGKRDGLGGECGRGRRPPPSPSIKRDTPPFSMGVFPSRAFFLQMFQPTSREGACATEALSTKDIHQGLCFQVLLVADASVCGSG